MAIRLKTSTSSDGITYSPRKSFFHDWMGRIFTALLLAIGIQIVLLIFLASNVVDLGEDFPLRYIFIAVFVIIFLVQRNPHGITIDTTGRRIMDDQGNWIKLAENSKVTLVRDFAERTSRSYSLNRSTSTSSTNYYANWIIALGEGESALTVLSHEIKKGTETDPELYNQVWIQQLAEENAEHLSIDLIDLTGSDHIVRKAGTTDTSLRDILKQQGTVPYSGELPDALASEFDVKEIKGGYRITDQDLDFNWNFVVVLVVMVMSFFSDDILIRFLILLFGSLYLIFSLNRIILRNHVEITSEKITLRQKGLVFNKYKESMGIDELEMILKIGVFGKSGIELISDELRILMFGKFDERELDFLNQLVTQILVAV